MALGIPIKMVVLTIVGMAGLGAMLAIIETGESAIPRQIHADISGNLILLPAYNDTDIIEIRIGIFDSGEGTPLYRASAVLSGPAAAVNITDTDGSALLRFKKTDFDMKTGEDYLKLEVKADGFQDYVNEFAIKIVR